MFSPRYDTRTSDVVVQAHLEVDRGLGRVVGVELRVLEDVGRVLVHELEQLMDDARIELVDAHRLENQRHDTRILGCLGCCQYVHLQCVYARAREREAGI